MLPKSKRWIWFAVVVVATPGLIYYCLVVLTISFGKIVGYADRQPALQVVQSGPKSPPEEVARMLRLAKAHVDGRPGLRELYWPEPSVIEERTSCWLVTFQTKVPVYRLFGFTQTLRPTDPAMYLSIDKADLRTRFGKWCQ